MNPLDPQADEQARLERRRERARALRACRPIERVFLKGLPKARYSPYTAAKQLGMSDSTAWKIMRRARVRKAMELFLQDALDELGVSHASLVADLVAIKERCMQCEPVLDDEGKPTGMFQFDARAAIAAVKEIADLLKLAPARRIDLTLREGNAIPAPMFHVSFEDGGPGDYGIEVSGKLGHDVPSSDAIN